MTDCLDQLKNTTIREDELTASNNHLEKNSIQEAEHFGHLIEKRSPNNGKKRPCNSCRKKCENSWQKRETNNCQNCLRNKCSSVNTRGRFPQIPGKKRFWSMCNTRKKKVLNKIGITWIKSYLFKSKQIMTLKLFLTY